MGGCPHSARALGLSLSQSSVIGSDISDKARPHAGSPLVARFWQTLGSEYRHGFCVQAIELPARV